MSTSPKAQDASIWQARWQALDSTSAELAARYGALTNFPCIPTLLGMIQSLRAFADDQFHFFYDGFGLGKPKPKYRLASAPDDEFAPEHVFAVVLDQTADDLEVIQRVMDQRVTAEEQTSSGTSPLKTTLAQADQLARNALQPAIRAQLISADTIPIAYFQKSTTIRVIPYASIALIGIPFSCVTVPEDLLAMPHEVGHYVYWNGKVGGESLRRALFRSASQSYGDGAALAGWSGDWVEEIFADVYGCLVGGAVMALDFQDLELASSRAGFVADDGKHPVPLLRPEVYLGVLKRKGEPASLVGALESRWRQKVKARKIETDDFTPHDAEADGAPPGGSAPPTITFDEARAEIENIIDQIMRVLGDLSSDWPLAASAAQARQAAPARPTVQDLYADFKQSLSRVVVDDFAERTTPIDLGCLWQDWVRREKFLQGALPPQLPQTMWTPIFAGAGWTAKGPKNDPPP